MGAPIPIVAAGAPTVANDAMRYLFRMFHFAAKRKWIESNPVYGSKSPMQDSADARKHPSEECVA
jgi:hypothetical protein